MTFTITYRSPSGALQKEVVEAANRAKALEDAKARGITPVSVKEGGTLAAVKEVAKPAWVKGAVAGLIVVVLALVAVFCLMPSPKPAPAKPEKPKKVKVEKPKPEPGARRAKPAVTNVVPVPAPKQIDAKAARREMMKKMTPDERWEYLVKQVQDRPLPAEPASNRLFRTALEQSMDWVFSCEVGNPPPLLPPKMTLFDELHLAEILISDNKINETDSEKAKEAKERMQLAKKEFRDFIKQGGAPEDFLPYYHGQLVQAHEEWKEARKSVIETVKNDPGIASEYLKKINERLSGKGIKKVTLPPKLLEKYGIEIEE